MATVTEKLIDAYASCKDGRCVGYKQEPVKAIETLTEWSYIDLGGDIPGIERSTTMLAFADLADAQCPHCGEPRLVSDQVRPIYPNVSGQPQDFLLHQHDGIEQVRDLRLEAAEARAQMAQMQATMERQAALIERLMAQQDVAPAPARARRGRPVEDNPQA